MGQNKALVDSIKSVLPKISNDSVRQKLLCKLAINTTPQDGVLYAQEALVLAKKKENNVNQALAY